MRFCYLISKRYMKIDLKVQKNGRSQYDNLEIQLPGPRRRRDQFIITQNRAFDIKRIEFTITFCTMVS